MIQRKKTINNNKKHLEVIREKIKNLRYSKLRTNNEVQKCEINRQIEVLAKEANIIQSSKLNDKIQNLHPSEIKDNVEPIKEEIKIETVVDETEKTVNGVTPIIEDDNNEETSEEEPIEDGSSLEDNSYKYNKKKHRNKYRESFPVDNDKED